MSARVLNKGGNASASARFEYPFGGVITCAVCRELMRCFKMHTKQSVSGYSTYYTCFTENRGLACSASVRSTPGHIVETMLGDLLRHYQLGDTWRDDLLGLLDQQSVHDYRAEIEKNRKKLEAEKKALNVMLRAGGIEVEEYEREMQAVNARLAHLPKPEEEGHYRTKAVEAGEVLASLSACWEAAQSEKNYSLMGEYVNSLLRVGGLVWDSEKRAIVALRPHPEYFPVLLLVMGKEWKQEGEYLMCEHAREYKAEEKPRTLSAEQMRHIELLKTQGLSVRGIAEELGLGHMTVHRYLRWRKGSEEPERT